MAFTAANLSCIGIGNGPKLYLYKSADTTATIFTVGYFRDADGNRPEGINQNDVILMILTSAYLYLPTVVSAVAATYVTLSREGAWDQAFDY